MQLLFPVHEDIEREELKIKRDIENDQLINNHSLYHSFSYYSINGLNTARSLESS